MHSKRIPGRTRRHHTAGIRVAGVWFLHALLVAALVALLTVVITLALRPAAGDGVGFGNEAGQAVADRVSQSINLAACSRTAGRRVAGVGFLHASITLAGEGGNGKKLDIGKTNPFYRCCWQTKPSPKFRLLRQSLSTVHSGPQPTMVSGIGTKPG